MLTTNLITQELHIIKSFRKFVNLCARLGLGQLQRVSGAGGEQCPLPEGQHTPPRREPSLCKSSCLGSDFVGKGEDVVPARPLPCEMRAARVKEGKRGTL